MKWTFVFCIALFSSPATRAQDKFIKISDTVETNRQQRTQPGPKGACYARLDFKGRSMKKMPGFPQEFKVRGRVIVNITVDVSGKVIAYKLLSADPGCFNVAKEILKYIQFPQLDTLPVKSEATISFIFQKGTDYKD